MEAVKLGLAHACHSVKVTLGVRRCYSVDSDAEGRQFQCCRPCEHFHASFAHGVPDDSRVGAATLVTADIDDDTLGLLEKLEEKVSQEEGRPYVDISEVVPILRIRCRGRTRKDDASAIDKNIKSTKLLSDSQSNVN